MKSIAMKKLKPLLAIGLLVAALSAYAVDRPLGDATLTNPAGTQSNLKDLARSQQWLILVLDADKGISREALGRLEKAGVDWESRLVIITQGSAKGAEAARKTGEKISGAQWYAAPAGAASKAVGVGALPAIVMVRDAKVVSSVIGFTDGANNSADASPTCISRRGLRDVRRMGDPAHAQGRRRRRCHPGRLLRLRLPLLR
jgi:hypothetical protein